MLEDILRERNKKAEIYEKEESAFPSRCGDYEFISAILSDFATCEKKGKSCTVVGRIFSIRDQGKIIFFDIKDETGRVQGVCDEESTERFELFSKTIDIGDILQISGIPFTTKKGQQSIKVSNFSLLAKSFRPIPSEWYGIEDAELRLRKRYLDFILNDDTRDIFHKKAIFWQTIRNFLKKENFLEVDTSALEPVPGGAEARPFVTHHNALDEDFYLRISLELPLKKLLVGGFSRVFEIGRIFRNEGIDREHLQDYIQMECYASFKDYNWMMEQMQVLYREIVQNVFGSDTTVFRGEKIQWGKKWEVVDYYEIFKKETGINLADTSRKDLEKKMKELKIPLEPSAGDGRLIDLIFKTIRPKLVQPCFLINPPVCIEPLAKRMEKDKNRVERFQIVACGTELGKGFSELNDPRDQRARFEEQMKLREKGDVEAQMIDESFIEALEYGMPPAAGFGLSERLFSVLMDKSIRETSLFPLMKKEEYHA